MIPARGLPGVLFLGQLLRPTYLNEGIEEWHAIVRNVIVPSSNCGMNLAAEAILELRILGELDQSESQCIRL